MAKMFYSAEEAQKVLGCTADELKDFAFNGKLREFRDGKRLLFRGDQVDEFAAERKLETAAIPLDLDALSLPADDDGSGLLSLERESDDTTLGAALLDEITSYKSGGGRAKEDDEFDFTAENLIGTSAAIRFPLGTKNCAGPGLKAEEIFVLIPVLGRSKELFSLLDNKPAWAAFKEAWQAHKEGKPLPKDGTAAALWRAMNACPVGEYRQLAIHIPTLLSMPDTEAASSFFGLFTKQKKINPAAPFADICMEGMSLICSAAQAECTDEKLKTLKSFLSAVVAVGLLEKLYKRANYPVGRAPGEKNLLEERVVHEDEKAESLGSVLLKIINNLGTRLEKSKRSREADLG